MAVRTGLYFSFDALVAALVIIGAVSLVAQTDFTNDVQTVTAEYGDVDSAAEDSVQVMMRTPMQQALNASEQETLVATSNLTMDDMNDSVMDNVAILWGSGEQQQAASVIESFIGPQIPEGYGYRIRVEEGGNSSIIYSSGAGFEEASLVARSSRLVSGVARDQPTRGFTASASLTNAGAINAEYFFFGGYTGDGNLTANVSLPDYENVESVVIEGDIASNFTVEINGTETGVFSPSDELMRADRFTVCDGTTNTDLCEGLTSGNTLIDINFYGNASIGGGFLRIDYNQTYSLDQEGEIYRVREKRLPGINGVINLYDGFIVPGTLQGLSLDLHYDSRQEMFARIGNVTVHESNTSQDIRISNASIYDALAEANVSYQDLSNDTVPFRLGVQEFTEISTDEIEAATALDISGSMEGDRMDEAKTAAKNFSTTVLESQGSRVGFSAYEEYVRDYFPMSSDEQAIHDAIDALDPGGTTCVACGILNATDLVAEPVQDWFIEPGGPWYWNATNMTEPLEDAAGRNWTQSGYNHSWMQDRAVLGRGTSVDATLPPTEGSYFFRKSFQYNKSDYRDPTVLIRSDDAAEIYLNGHRIDTTTRSHEGAYWNRITGETTFYMDRWSFTETFPSGTLSSNWTVTEGTEGGEIELNSDCGTVEGSYAMHFAGTDTQVTAGFDYGEDHLSSITFDVFQGDETGGFFFSPDCAAVSEDDDLYVEYLDADGRWHIIETIEAGTDEPTRDQWHQMTVDIPTAMAHPDGQFRITRSYQTGFFERPGTWAIDNITVTSSIGENVEALDQSILNDGNNVIAAELAPGTDRAEFDLALNATQDRLRAMVVMSDGVANTETYMPGVTDDPQEQAIEAGCRANERHDITVYAVGFGNRDEIDEETLNQTAQCGGGEYYYADTGELVEVFEDIGSNILEAARDRQRITVDDPSFNDTLYPDSKLVLNYTQQEQRDFGEVRLDQESDPFGGSVSSPKNGSFMVPEGTMATQARVYSYSDRFWTDRVLLEDDGWRPVFRLWKYSDQYEDIGEPFQFMLPTAELGTGVKNVSIDTGSNRTTREGGSPDARVIYDVLVDGTVGFTEVFNKSEGGNTSFQSDYGQINISIGDTNDTWDPESDAVDDAVQRMMDQLDVDEDGRVDLRVNDENIDINENSMSGLQWLWGPASVSVEVWKE